MVDIISKLDLSVSQVKERPSLVSIWKVTAARLSLGFWRLTDKIGLPLEEIHIQGKVPQCTTSFLPEYILVSSPFFQLTSA